jgi:hypothetical protein
MTATITLEEYLGKQKPFVVPDYQRGYVWGKNRVGEKDSVTNLIDDLILRFQNSKDVFLQGFTVTEKDNEIILIDGQQRTTCLYLLLKSLGYKEKFDIKYEIRDESQRYLDNLNNSQNVDSEEFQDVFFFNKTLSIISEKTKVFKDLDKYSFMKFLLTHVKFLYIDIPEEQASNVFTMMNGSKADMLQEEIIKAEILRLASINPDDTSPSLLTPDEWENNSLRSRYARDWDKWLHWWNNDDVKSIFKTQGPMGLLLVTYWKKCNTIKNVKFCFDSFKNLFLKNENAKEAKDTFCELRRLQKKFEDAFRNPITRNQIGAILRLMNLDNREAFVQSYFNDEFLPSYLPDYYASAFIGMTHKEIIEKNYEMFEKKRDEMLAKLSDDFLYENDKESAFRILLRLNIDEDNKQNGGKGRYFDFSIWDNGNRSLEHIYPKSKVGHFVKNEQDADGYWVGGDGEKREEKFFTCKRDEIKLNDGSGVTSEHSIGNLVLLYKGDNSSFSNRLFNEKKMLFFDTNIKEYFNSRHLLHTIYLFAHSEWNGKDIAVNKQRILDDFIEYYKKIKENYYEKK